MTRCRRGRMAGSAGFAFLAASLACASAGEPAPATPATPAEAIAQIRKHVAEGILSLRKGEPDRYPFQKAADLRLAYRIRYTAWPDAHDDWRAVSEHLTKSKDALEGARDTWVRSIALELAGQDEAAMKELARYTSRSTCGNAAEAEVFALEERRAALLLHAGKPKEAVDHAESVLKPLSISISGVNVHNDRLALLHGCSAAAWEEARDIPKARQAIEKARAASASVAKSWNLYYDDIDDVQAVLGAALGEMGRRLRP